VTHEFDKCFLRTAALDRYRWPFRQHVDPAKRERHLWKPITHAIGQAFIVDIKPGKRFGWLAPSQGWSGVQLKPRDRWKNQWIF
jgi:hypothetical protein